MQYGGAYGAASMANPWTSKPQTYSQEKKGYQGLEPRRRKSLNVVSILIALFAPWLEFCFVFAILSFGLHYQQPLVAYALIALAFLLGVCIPCVVAADSKRRQSIEGNSNRRTWFVFLAGTCALAFVIAGLAGESNYFGYMKPYYNIGHLHHYQDIDTNAVLGQNLMDAGWIEFKQDTALDLARSMGFKDHDVYCVAPIVTKAASGAAAAASVDFWAVGKNCCSGVQADFHCDGFSDPTSRGGVRLMNDDDRLFYRLAVQQAEATYKMTATHPLFFEWVRDTDEATNQYAQRGRLNFFMGISAYFLLQMFLVGCTTVIFSTMTQF